MGEKPGFMVYHDLYESLSFLPLESVGKLLMAMFDFSINGVEPDFSEITLRILWPQIRGSLTRDNDRYDDIVLKRKYAAYVRWEKERGNEPQDFQEWMQANADVCTCIDVHCGALQTIPTTTPTTATTTTSTSTSTSTTNNTTVGSAEEKEGLGEKETTLSPADAFLLRHKDDADSDFVMLCYNSMKGRERTAYFN